jgi:hypothetical protein
MSDSGEDAVAELRDFELDDPLLEPPSVVVSPLVDPQLEYLPIDQMSWENFERLLLRVAEEIRGLHSVMKFGNPGQAQKGLDVIGVNADGRAEGIQSKRRKSFTANDLDAAVEKYTTATLSFPLARLAIGLSKPMAERKIVEHLIDLNVTLAPLEIDIWDQDKLSRMLRPFPQIVTEFFGQATAARFCTEHSVITVEIAGEAAVATADAVSRGPLTTVGGRQKVEEARVIAATDPAAALALYRDVQSSLTAAGFPAHAAEFDEQVAYLLVATGAESDAVGVVLERLWVAERADDSLSAQVAARTLKSLAGFSDLDFIQPTEDSSTLLVSAALVAEFVADNLHQPVPTELELPVEAMRHLSPEDRSQTVLFAAERALCDDDFDWLDRQKDLMADSAFDVASVRDDVALRLELAIAESTGEWNDLLHRARTTTRRDLGALTLARYARYTMWRGDYLGADRAWEEAINHACLSHRNEDAIDWLYSRRLVTNRHAPVHEDEWHPLARSLSNLTSRPRLVTSTSTSREYALAALHHGKERVAAVNLRRYLCDAIRSGSLVDEIDARGLLGDLYAKTNEMQLAARQLILAHDYESARSVARDLGDTFLDVSDLAESPVSWVTATAFEFTAGQADVVPDDVVDGLVGTALAAIQDVQSERRVDSPIYSPQIVRSAYNLIGELSERLNHDHAASVLQSLSDHVTAREHHYWMTDESHIRIAAGIALTASGDLKVVALEHLMGLYERRAHPFSNTARDALKANMDAVQAHLQRLADNDHHDAAALLATIDERQIRHEDSRAAAQRLQRPTTNSAGRYAEGTRAINDSLLARDLPPDERAACIEALLAKARSPFEGSGNRHTYFMAAANLSEGIAEERRQSFFADVVDFVKNPPPSQPDILNASMTSPLGMMRWDGNLDSRPSAVLAAGFFAHEDGEKGLVRDLAFRLIGIAGDQDYYLAQALQVLKVDLAEIAPMLSQAGWALRSVAAIAWASTATIAPEVGERLSADSDARVRRSLATALKKSPETRTANVRAKLAVDPRWSVRSILAD